MQVQVYEPTAGGLDSALKTLRKKLERSARQEDLARHAYARSRGQRERLKHRRAVRRLQKRAWAEERRQHRLEVARHLQFRLKGWVVALPSEVRRPPWWD
jgi:hypothetical protein